MLRPSHYLLWAYAEEIQSLPTAHPLLEEDVERAVSMLLHYLIYHALNPSHRGCFSRFSIPNALASSPPCLRKPESAYSREGLRKEIRVWRVFPGDKLSNAGTVYIIWPHLTLRAHHFSSLNGVSALRLSDEALLFTATCAIVV
jgi:hypothetical protein